MDLAGLSIEQILEAIGGGNATARILFGSMAHVLEERFGREEGHAIAKEVALRDLSEERLDDGSESWNPMPGTLFLSMVRVLEGRFEKEEAHAIARDVVRQKSNIIGERARQQFGTGGFEELKTAHLAGFPNIEVVEFSPARYVVRDTQCPVFESWRRKRLSPERIKELGDLYCWGDLYVAQAFNPDIRLEFKSRLTAGNPFCQWQFTLPPPKQSE